MENNVREAYEKYVALGEEIKRLTEERAQAQAEIKRLHKERGMDMICEDGFKSQLIPQVTKALNKARVVEKFGEEQLADCWTETTKTNFRCERMVNG